MTLTELHRVCDYAGDGAKFKPDWKYVRNDVVHKTVIDAENVV